VIRYSVRMVEILYAVLLAVKVEMAKTKADWPRIAVAREVAAKLISYPEFEALKLLHPHRRAEHVQTRVAVIRQRGEDRRDWTLEIKTTLIPVPQAPPPVPEPILPVLVTEPPVQTSGLLWELNAQRQQLQKLTIFVGGLLEALKQTNEIVCALHHDLYGEQPNISPLPTMETKPVNGIHKNAQSVTPATTPPVTVYFHTKEEERFLARFQGKRFGVLGGPIQSGIITQLETVLKVRVTWLPCEAISRYKLGDWAEQMDLVALWEPHAARLCRDTLKIAKRKLDQAGTLHACVQFLDPRNVARVVMAMMDDMEGLAQQQEKESASRNGA
jgi:hypothetical protein